MKPIYAVALGVSQGQSKPNASAFLTLRTEDTHADVAIEWPNLPALEADGDMATWLYGVLTQLVTNFDDHSVIESAVEGTMAMEDGHRA